MLAQIPLSKILFLDIETVPIYPSWKEADEMTQKLWTKKTERQRADDWTAEEFYDEKAGIWAEFAKIVCISLGIVVNEKIRLKSFTGDEVSILENFNALLESSYYQNGVIFCAHNGKEFDYPFLSRRMVIHQIPLPYALQNYGKKPWEISHLDTLELWKFGDYKHYTSLELLAHILSIPTPKEEMSGADVKDVFYREEDISKIQKYCEGDVVTLINIFRKIRFESPLERE